MTINIYNKKTYIDKNDETIKIKKQMIVDFDTFEDKYWIYANNWVAVQSRLK